MEFPGGSEGDQGHENSSLYKRGRAGRTVSCKPDDFCKTANAKNSKIPCPDELQGALRAHVVKYKGGYFAHSRLECVAWKTRQPSWKGRRHFILNTTLPVPTGGELCHPRGSQKRMHTPPEPGGNLRAPQGRSSIQPLNQRAQYSVRCAHCSLLTAHCSLAHGHELRVSLPLGPFPDSGQSFPVEWFF